MAEYVGAIDQGTTSTRFVVFDRRGAVVASAQRPHEQIFPQPGWVEHDPREIWRNVQAVTREAMAAGGLDPRDLAAVGLTNQRETALVWDRRTGLPLHNALVWQDTRVDPLVAALARDGAAERIRALTGLPLASYFSALKLRWLLDAIEGARTRAEAGDVLCGTIDAWLVWNMTGGTEGGCHVTDVTNASRTQLMDLRTLGWDADLLGLLGVPAASLPRIVPSVAPLAEMRTLLPGVPLSAILGDQQAALFGHACFEPGEAKNTYGTGCFALMNTGTEPVASASGLVTTLAYRIGEAAPVYALEGSVAIAGALVQWLRDNLGLIEASDDVEILARTVEDNGDVYFVPAFSGLYAPHWRADARGIIAGLTRYANKGHIARAALEATAYQTREVMEAMTRDSGVVLDALRCDGGMVVNDLLMQFQADILGVPTLRPMVRETTALGAAYAAGLAVGHWPSLAALRENGSVERRWHPRMTPERRASLFAAWGKAVERSHGWATGA